MGSNLVLKDKMLSIQALEPFFILENVLNSDEHGNQSIEPKKIIAPYRQNIPNASLRPNMCGSRDDVRTYGYKAERAAALIYAHFRKEFLLPVRR